MTIIIFLIVVAGIFSIAIALDKKDQKEHDAKVAEEKRIDEEEERKTREAWEREKEFEAKEKAEREAKEERKRLEAEAERKRIAEEQARKLEELKQTEEYKNWELENEPPIFLSEYQRHGQLSYQQVLDFIEDGKVVYFKLKDYNFGVPSRYIKVKKEHSFHGEYVSYWDDSLYTYYITGKGSMPNWFKDYREMSLNVRDLYKWDSIVYICVPKRGI